MNIIELAEQAGLAYKTPNGKYWIDAGYPDIHLERFAELVAAAEREACAKLCEPQRPVKSYTGGVPRYATTIALAQSEPFKPDWDMIEPYHERIKELEIENEKLRQALAQHEQEHESRITALEIRVAKLENPITDHEKQLMAGQRSLLRTTSVSKPEPVVEPANSATNFVESKHLAQPEQEPDAYMTYKGYLYHASDPKVLEHSDPTPLYTAPPSKPWQSLTEEERRTFASWLDFKTDDEVFNAIEAALRSKNT